MKVALAVALATLPMAAQAQDAEVPSVVATFEQICLTGGVDPSARVANLTAAGWIRNSEVYIDVPSLAISKAIERNFDFSKPQMKDNWSGMIDGRPAKVVLATFPTKSRYPNLCALTVDGIKNAMPYGGTVRAAFKKFGIGGKSVDLVHYFEFAGKIGTDKHPVRGEIFTRSVASGGEDSMHIYVAY